ncbi:hypothetical protein NQZ68_017874 [Dissostichus eleginoides]|nr:hypothetical protein NQZ68_017874 [Dissostichus eleginoides]
MTRALSTVGRKHRVLSAWVKGLEKRLESLSVVREKARTSPLEKDSAQTPERGRERREKDPGESEPGGRMVQ